MTTQITPRIIEKLDEIRGLSDYLKEGEMEDIILHLLDSILDRLSEIKQAKGAKQ